MENVKYQRLAWQFLALSWWGSGVKAWRQEGDLGGKREHARSSKVGRRLRDHFDFCPPGNLLSILVSAQVIYGFLQI